MAACWCVLSCVHRQVIKEISQKVSQIQNRKLPHNLVLGRQVITSNVVCEGPFHSSPRFLRILRMGSYDIFCPPLFTPSSSPLHSLLPSSLPPLLFTPSSSPLHPLLLPSSPPPLFTPSSSSWIYLSYWVSSSWSGGVQDSRPQR